MLVTAPTVCPIAACAAALQALSGLRHRIVDLGLNVLGHSLAVLRQAVADYALHEACDLLPVLPQRLELLRNDRRNQQEEDRQRDHQAEVSQQDCGRARAAEARKEAAHSPLEPVDQRKQNVGQDEREDEREQRAAGQP